LKEDSVEQLPNATARNADVYLCDILEEDESLAQISSRECSANFASLGILYQSEHSPSRISLDACEEDLEYCSRFLDVPPLFVP